MMTPIAPLIEAFLRDNLSRHRGASQHTCDSYGYSFQLLFEFAAARLGITPSSLSLEQLDASRLGSRSTAMTAACNPRRH
jgi:integrase/recombinase XerD